MVNESRRLSAYMWLDEFNNGIEADNGYGVFDDKKMVLLGLLFCSFLKEILDYILKIISVIFYFFFYTNKIIAKQLPR